MTRLLAAQEFAGPGIEEVGLRSYAILNTGQRVLIRRRAGERVEITPAGRRFFACFRNAVVPIAICVP